MYKKTYQLTPDELTSAFATCLSEEGLTVETIKLTVDEALDEDVAIITTNEGEIQRTIESFHSFLNSFFTIEIIEYLGVDDLDCADVTQGYFFAIA